MKTNGFGDSRGYQYTEAGLKEQAIPCWQKAGQRASQRSANVEAISQFTKGLELLNTLPETHKRNQQELTLQLALSTPLVSIKGQGSAEVEVTYLPGASVVSSDGRNA